MVKTYKDLICGCASLKPIPHARFRFTDCECAAPRGKVLFKVQVLTVKEL